MRYTGASGSDRSAGWLKVQLSKARKIRKINMKSIKYREDLVTVDEWIQEGSVKPKRASINDLASAADWIEQFETDDPRMAQAMANASQFLMKEISRRNRKDKK